MNNGGTIFNQTTLALAYQQTINKIMSEKDELNKQWYLACKEIIDRCVAPNMYGNAIELLEMAYLQSNKGK